MYNKREAINMKVFSTFAIIFIAFFGALAGAPQAHAASAYDTTIKTTNVPPTVYDGVDVTTSYLTTMLDCTKWANNPTEQNFCNSFVTSWNSRTLDTGWSLGQYTQPGYTHTLTANSKTIYADSYVIFSFSPTDDPYTFTDIYGGSALETTNGTYHIELGAIYDPGQPDDKQLTVSGNNSQAYLSTSRDNNLEMIFNNATITYPAGYAGEVPATSLKPVWKPEDTSKIFTPTYTYSVADLNFTATDTSPKSAIAKYNISLCMFQIPNNTAGDAYTEYDYDCNIKPTVTATFPSHANYNVIQRYYSAQDDMWYETTQVINIDGTTYSGNVSNATSMMQKCMTTVAPYIDMQGCYKSFQYIIDAMSFGGLKWGTNWESSTQCHTLGTLGDWLNLDPANRTVCPEIPDGVRGIITPFVTLLLGLTIMTFIARNKGSEW